MASPLEGAIAAAVNSAFQPLFLDATLTRGGDVYDCKAIFDTWQKYSIKPNLVSSYRVLVLANSLAVEPAIYDIVTLQGINLEIASDLEGKPAIEIDPARAVWILRSRPVEIGLRIIAIHRPGTIAAPGSSNVATLITTYSGETIAAETVLYAGITASIEYHSRDRRGTAPMPADIQNPGGWTISIPLAAGIPNGGITENDVVIDDTAPPRRYQIEAAYNHSLGWTLHCRFLKA